MFVERYGTGQEIYFALHGWGAEHTAFAPLAPHVPARAVLYAADLPGCGRSPAPHEWSVAAVVDEIAAGAASLGARELTIVGNCAGAIFALLVARRMMTVVQRVVLIDAFAYLPRYFKLFVSEGFGRRAYNATFANPVGRWLTNQTLRGGRNSETDLTESFATIDHEVARHYLSLLATAGQLAQFKDLAVPVEIIYGEKSFGAVKRSVALWRETIPHARVWRLAHAGHMTITEAAERVSAIIFAPTEALHSRPEMRESEVQF